MLKTLSIWPSMLVARENVPVLPSRSLFNEPISDGANSKTIVSRKKIILELCAFRDHEIQRSNAIPHFCIEIGRGIGSHSQPLTILFHSTYPRNLLKECFIFFNFVQFLRNFSIFGKCGDLERWYIEQKNKFVLKGIRYLPCSFNWKEWHFRHDDTY